MDNETLRIRSEKGLFKKYKKLGKIAIKEAADRGDFRAEVPYPIFNYEKDTDSYHRVREKLKEWYKSKNISTGMVKAGSPHDIMNVFWEIKSEKR